MSAGAVEDYEKPPVLQASKLLSKDVLKGKLHTVEEDVQNDGYLNTYTITSPLGTFKAVGTPLLHTRIHEIYAMDAMDKVNLGEEFGNSVVDGGKRFVKGVGSLFRDPLGSLEKASSGVAKAFGRAEESLMESSASDQEDSGAQRLIGFSKTKRDYAAKFKVDPYSTNDAMQERLDKISWAGYSGGVGFGAVSFVLPGTAAMAFSVVRGAETLKDVDLTVAPADMRKANREKLIRMGVTEDVAKLFINNTVFSPSQQSYLVSALDKCQGVDNRQAFVTFAVATHNQDVALFRQNMAIMYMDFHLKHGKLAGFITVDKFVAAKTAAGELLVCFPLDYAIWSSSTEAVMRSYDARVKELGFKKKRIRFTGSLSPVARKRLQAAGWVVEEKQ